MNTTQYIQYLQYNAHYSKVLCREVGGWGMGFESPTKWVQSAHDGLCNALRHALTHFGMSQEGPEFKLKCVDATPSISVDGVRSRVVLYVRHPLRW